VGGGVESGETPAEALLREIHEEINLNDFSQLIPLEKFTSESGNFEYHTYLITVENEFVPELNDEHRGYAWTSIDDHPKPLHPGVWRTFNFKVILDKIKTFETALEIAF
jgi:8-oxo-dGTP pyrophosphatase MutT (NUDIX family)